MTTDPRRRAAPRYRQRPSATRSLFDPAIMRPASATASASSTPAPWPATRSCSWSRSAASSPRILFLRDLGSSTAPENVFAGLVALWLWFTVLFANFAEAVAEGRGKAQADTLRRTRPRPSAHRPPTPTASIEEVPSHRAASSATSCVVSAGEVIPSDGDVVEGIASVDESAITGESAPVIRESGGDRSAVTGGTRVLSDEIVVRITARPGRDASSTG